MLAYSGVEDKCLEFKIASNYGMLVLKATQLYSIIISAFVAYPSSHTVVNGSWSISNICVVFLANIYSFAVT